MKKIISLFLTFLLTLSFTACTNDNSYDYSVSFDVDGVPGTLDPQLVTTASELVVISGIFEGLLRLEKDGTVVNGAAESCKISSDEKTYTFTLREGLLWSDEEPLTARDFAFGITRALLPETRSPYASLLFSIKNAKEVYNGTLPASELGIKATDDHTLTITLDYRDPDFTHTLTQPLCMPCRQDFFESTNGKYGMNTDLIICNGPFFVRRWSQTTSSLSMRLTRSDRYYDRQNIKPAAVLLYFNNQPQDRVTDLVEDQRDSGYINHELIADAKKNGLNIDSALHANWAVYFRPDSEMNRSDTMRAIFAYCIDKEQFKPFLDENYTLTNRLLPTSYSVGKSTYGDYTKGTSFTLRHEKPQSLTQSYLDELNALKLKDEYVFLYCDETPALSNIARAIAQCWQKSLGVSVTLKSTSEANLNDAIKQADYDAAFVPMGISCQQAKPLLCAFESESPDNIYRFSNANYDTLMTQAKDQSESALAAQLLSAEQFLVENAYLFPVVSESRSIVFDNDISNIRIVSIRGNIDFRQAVKEK